MSNYAQLHDLLLFGTDMEGANRTEAINNLAKLLKTSYEQAEALQKKQSVVLLKKVSIDVAKKNTSAS